MRRISPLPAFLAFTAAAFADPATPPGHPEKNFRAIGGDLFVRRDEDFTPDEGGNIAVTVFSHNSIEAGGHYSVDLSRLAGSMVGVSLDKLAVDAGSLGELRIQMVTIDCTHQTYEAVDVRKVFPEFIWRPASTLPALAPVFKYVCKEAAERAAVAAQEAAAAEVERIRQAETERVAAAQRLDAQRAEIQQRAAARYQEMPGEYQEARKESSFGARFRAGGLNQIPLGGKDGACSRLLVSSGWSKPLADVACHDQTVDECAKNLTTEIVSAKDIPLVSTAVATSTNEVCGRVRSVTNPPHR